MLGPINELQKLTAITMGKGELMVQTMEECGELIQALNKYRRVHGVGQPMDMGDGYTAVRQAVVNKVIEELVDVQICMKELEYMLGISPEDEQAVEKYKSERTKNRYEAEGVILDKLSCNVYEASRSHINCERYMWPSGEEAGC